MTKATKAGHTEGPWFANQTKGWGDDWCIEADAYGARPLAKCINHPDVYYQQVRKPIRGEEVITFVAETVEGETQKSARLAESAANARLIAAAPDFLAAALKLKRAADEGDADLSMEAHDELFAAIAKALPTSGGSNG